MIPAPPADLFDLVLVDEAHHAPARTWSRLLDLLGTARQVLFTATPFRRDEKEIKGKFLFEDKGGSLINFSVSEIHS